MEDISTLMITISWLMIAVFLFCIMTKKLSPFTALIIIPIIFSVGMVFTNTIDESNILKVSVDDKVIKEIKGDDLTAEQIKINEIAKNIISEVKSAGKVGAAGESKGKIKLISRNIIEDARQYFPESLDKTAQFNALASYILNGLKKLAPTGIMLLFAIFYFSFMLDAGMFDPITKKMVQFAKGDPLKVILATAVVSASISLNGDGTTTTLVVCAAFLPLYKRLKIDIMNLGVVLIMMNTIMNLLPWGGPTARAISVMPGLENSAGEILALLAPGMIVATIYMFVVSYYLGLRERKRLGVIDLSEDEINAMLTNTEDSDRDPKYKRPHLFWFNLVTTIILITILMLDVAHPAVIFLIGCVIALMVNFPNQKDQKSRIQDNAGDALQVVIVILAAGVFAGLFSGTGMANAVALSLIDIIPASWGSVWGLVVSALSAPGTFFLSNDAFYYGVLPVLGQAGFTYGWTPMEMAVASLMGQAFHLLSPLVPFIYLLLNLTGLDMGQWQKQSAKWGIGVFIIFVGVAGITGAVPFIK